MDCPKCSYPNMEGVSTCTNCGHDLTKSIVISKNDYIKVVPSESIKISSENNIQATDINKTLRYPDVNSESLDLNKTISDQQYHIITGNNVKQETTEIPVSNYLKPVYLKENSPSHRVIPFEEDLTIVRSLIDPSDSTISSKPHAVITTENNEWYLENIASNSAVFIQVKGKTKLLPGDVILVGADKFYEFKLKPKSE